MHETEGAGSVYLYGSFPADRVAFADAPTVDEVFVYVAAAGALGPLPTALGSIPAKGRTVPDADQHAMLKLARDRVAPGTPLDRFVLDTVADDALRRERVRALAADAVPWSVAGFTPLS